MRHTPRNARAFTLLEAMLSTVIISMIMMAMVSVTALSTRCLNSKGEDVGKASDVIDEITTDLNLAMSFSEQTATAATFTVPDRDNNGQSETIRYSWSGTPGDSIMREYNGGSAVVVAEDVQYFSLEYILKTIGGS
ncbi:MAG: prepilin-type N-terminal cleavage/methylation domain-containing protein [Phycisphaerae bacterium]|nr:prepilin-type N-terminal cleavage/methylation domain-containing protein [Phycisphaerae bacterium]